MRRGQYSVFGSSALRIPKQRGNRVASLLQAEGFEPRSESAATSQDGRSVGTPLADQAPNLGSGSEASASAPEERGKYLHAWVLVLGGKREVRGHLQSSSTNSNIEKLLVLLLMNS
jgi:hypothetical protein